MSTSLLLAAVLPSACSSESGLAGTGGPTPRVSIESPAPAAWVSLGDLRVRGTSTGVDQVQVDGQQALVDGDGGFSATLAPRRGIDLIEARGTAPAGDDAFDRLSVIAGTFADPGQPVREAAELRVNQPGLDSAMELAASLVTPELVNDAVRSMNPVFQDDYAWGLVDVSVDVDSIDFAPPSIAATPSAGVLSLEVEIPDLQVDLQAWGSAFGIDYDVDASMSAWKAVITGALTVSADSGRLEVELLDPAIELQDFSYDTSLLPGDVESWILVDTIRGMIEDLLVQKVEELVPSAIEDALGGLDLSFEMDVLGAPLSVAADFAGAEIDGDGLSLLVDVDASMPAAGDRAWSGYLAAPASEPAPSRSSQVSAAISDDLLNRLLFELWQGGALDLSLSTEDGTLDPLLLVPLHAQTGSISLDPGLPPVVVQSGGGLQLQVGELVATLDTPGGELGEHLVMAMALFVDLDLQVSEGTLELELGQPDISMMVRESDWGATPEATTRLFEQVLPIDSLMSLLGGFLHVPLPTLAGIGVDSATVDRDADGAHTDIELSLEY